MNGTHTQFRFHIYLIFEKGICSLLTQQIEHLRMVSKGCIVQRCSSLFFIIRYQQPSPIIIRDQVYISCSTDRIIKKLAAYYKYKQTTRTEDWLGILTIRWRQPSIPYFYLVYSIWHHFRSTARRRLYAHLLLHSAKASKTFYKELETIGFTTAQREKIKKRHHKKRITWYVQFCPCGWHLFPHRLIVWLGPHYQRWLPQKYWPWLWLLFLMCLFFVVPWKSQNFSSWSMKEFFRLWVSCIRNWKHRQEKTKYNLYSKSRLKRTEPERATPTTYISINRMAVPSNCEYRLNSSVVAKRVYSHSNECIPSFFVETFFLFFFVFGWCWSFSEHHHFHYWITDLTKHKRIVTTVYWLWRSHIVRVVPKTTAMYEKWLNLNTGNRTNDWLDDRS